MENRAIQTIVNNLLNPPMEFTPIPFWFYNDTPDKDKIKKQLTDYVEKGVNGIYLSHCRIYSPASSIKAPSTDAIDIDVCHDVLVKNCYLEVNDDSIVLKGGKGPWADTAPENGITPQHYEYILMEDIQGSITNFININPWTQFYDLQDRKDIPMSYADHVTMRNCNITCDTFFDVQPKINQYALSDFTLENLQMHAARVGYDYENTEYLHKKDVEVVLTDTRKRT